ncbi:MAG: hypothetical protein PSX71_00190 [bacterium]|nr:hypothetical protein [bacterium]
MWAVVIALAIAMWMWTAASLHLVRWWFKRPDAAVQLVYLAGMTALGAVALLLLPYLVLPGSVLSQGWTREVLEKTQYAAIFLVGIVAAAGFARAQILLLPAVKPVARVALKKPPEKKRP